MPDSRISGQVRIVGAGLLGASIGHGLSKLGVDVILDDASRANLALAVDYGAGRRPTDDDDPVLVVVAVPPDAAAEVVDAELRRWPHAIITDVVSVKTGILRDLSASGASLARYVGSHPLAGRERGGAVAARADLFVGRPWVITGAGGPAHRLVENLVLDLEALPVSMDAAEHDSAVATISHMPQIVSSLLAARLSEAAESTLGLSGQGLRDTTRVATSDPALWVQILSANAEPVARVLRSYRDDVSTLLAALEDPSAPGARRAIAELLSSGNTGVARIPGKHGGSRRFGQLIVMVDDVPGQLARLLTDIGDTGVNMEDLRLEHSPGAPVGLAEISVVPESEQRLAAELQERGWKIAGAFA